MAKYPKFLTMVKLNQVTKSYISKNKLLLIDANNLSNGIFVSNKVKFKNPKNKYFLVNHFIAFAKDGLKMKKVKSIISAIACYTTRFQK